MTETNLQDLFQQMTLDEKIGQLIQLDGSCYGTNALAVGPQQKLGITQETVDLSGSVLNVMGAEQIREIQDHYLSRSRLKIPLLFMADVIYGYKTVFPIPLGLGATWDPDLIHEDYKIIAKETAADGGMVTFSPPVDLIRDARWGRCLESPGEDVWLNQQYAAAMVTGFQGDMTPGESIASCVKHYAAYGAVEGGRDYNTVDMSERRLRQDYLPSYHAAVKAGCKLVMTSFNTIDGVPATANRWLMKNVLRDEWGFNGVLITDYAAIHELVAHGVAADDREASRLAMNATVDIDMKTSCYANNLRALVESGQLCEDQINEACMRVLRLKNELGLFEDPYRGACAGRADALASQPAHEAAARRTTQQSMVLLKNEGDLLPLKHSGQKIALIGPYADIKDIIGMWAVHADRSRAVTLRSAMEKRLSAQEFGWSAGCPILEDLSVLGGFGRIPAAQDVSLCKEAVLDLEQQALELARHSDIIVLAMGEHMLQSGEGGSRTDLTLPEPQKKLLHTLHALGKPIVLILFNGRPLVLTDIEQDCDAILEAWYPGTSGGQAIVDVLFGDAEPGGRLTVSFPRSVGQLPLYYDHFRTGRPAGESTHSLRFTSRYLDCPDTPLYPFGYGLSYHKAVYSPLTLSSDILSPSGQLDASVTVENVSSRPGSEVVQLYLCDQAASVVRPVKELKGFQRITLAPGEKKTVHFSITEEMLRFYTRSMEWRSEPGTFLVMVGPDSESLSCAKFELNA